MTSKAPLVETKLAGWTGLEAVGREGNPESSQAVTRTDDAESVSEKAVENAPDNESITRVIAARLASIATRVHSVPVERLREVQDALEHLERAVRPLSRGG